MDAQEFRQVAKAAIDEIVDWDENVASHRVVSDVKPGYLRPLLPLCAASGS
ncbi:hypothetical protein NW754_008578 [Fusarium falciforme]|nr:hypothetical protein NW754_008578 [Fusarium falciforme]